MTESGRPAAQPQLLAYARTVRRRKWTVIVVTLLAGGGALGFSETQTPVYQATAQVLLQPTASQQILGSSANSVPNIQDQISILEAPGVAALVRERLGSAPHVSASAVSGTDIMAVRADSTSPAQAARIANAYATAYIDFARTQTIDNLLAAGRIIQGRITTLQRQVTDLEAGSATGGAAQRAVVASQIAADEQQITVLTGQLGTVQSSIGLGSAGASLLAPAVAPSSPVTPKNLRNTLLGLGGGLVLGLGLAALREALDDTIVTKEDLDRTMPGLPVLAEIPEVSARRQHAPEIVSVARPHSDASEAYRTLRTSLQFLAIERSLRLIQVTSPRTTEGKTTTLANLAVALVGAGRQVIVVDCDLRRPRIHTLFGIDNSLGFTSVVLGESSLSAALQAAPGQEGLRLLAAGGRSSHPSELLSGEHAAEVLSALAEMADFVLVDSPPVLPVTDAVVLSPRMDATLVVVSSGTTGAKDLSRALEVLGQVDAPVVGAVLNAVPVPGRYGYRYYYRYGPYEQEPSAKGITAGPTHP